MRTEAGKVLTKLLEVMAADNGCEMPKPTGEEKARVLPAIAKLMDLGFFKDDPKSLDSSYWMAAAGEATEMYEYFAKGGEDWKVMDRVLQDVFNRAD
jgi:hypothetical protein